MTPCSLFIQRADSIFSPVSTAVPLSDVKNFSTAGGTNPTQTGDAIYDYFTPKQKAQIAKRDAKLTWRDSSRSLWTPPCGSVSHSSSRTRGVLTALILRPLSHIPMSVSGCGKLGYGKSAKFSPIFKQFAKVSPTKETHYTVHLSAGDFLKSGNLALSSA